MATYQRVDALAGSSHFSGTSRREMTRVNVKGFVSMPGFFHDATTGGQSTSYVGSVALETSL
jgi:hypothetical protein